MTGVFKTISFVTTLVLHYDKQNKEIIIYNSNKHFHSSFTHTLLPFFFLKYLIAPDILYLIKKAEKRISSLYESNKQKILWLVENFHYKVCVLYSQTCLIWHHGNIEIGSRKTGGH